MTQPNLDLGKLAKVSKELWSLVDSLEKYRKHRDAPTWTLFIRRAELHIEDVAATMLELAEENERLKKEIELRKISNKGYHFEF